ncbi:MAG: IS6 family transposase [Mesorhizobium sp.]|nr:MAG: IS6 family transposase [Mesorhizobium sp.]
MACRRNLSQASWPVEVFLSPIDSVGDTVEFWLAEHCGPPAARCFFKTAPNRHGRPDRVVIDGSQSQEAIISCDTTNRWQDRSGHQLKPIRSRRSRIEQSHRRINRRVCRCSAPGCRQRRCHLEAIEMVRMIRKQAR